MGDFSTHLNQWLDRDQPTLFELVAQRDLSNTLKPAFEYFLKVLAVRRPDSRWATAWRLNNELFLLVDLLLQNYYLKHTGASFSENFYSLRRSPRPHSPPSAKPDCCTAAASASAGHSHSTGRPPTALCHFHSYTSLFIVTFVPYLKQKLEDLYEALDSGQMTAHGRNQWRRRCLQLFQAVYPYFHFLWEGCFFLFQLAYLLRKTTAFTPLLYLAGLELRRVTAEDEELFDAINGSGKLLAPSNRSFLWRILSLPSRAGGHVVAMAASGLPVLAFLLKFMEWWQSDEGTASRQAARSTLQLPIPPPPTTATSAVHPPAHPVLCPLCGQVRRNSTALSVSGYVFCYTCLHNHLSRHGYCPVTHLPASTEQMVRIFVPDAG
ncbi:peroxisome assembly protein 12-like [Sycon ciliatum]|uniref:peroxisome assembly protein 12-like n=1 Tax=Sycon ciliatum TaxID=27933 RepID=UPI0031F651FC